jgi:WD40 repeat protein/predicted Ser/Thr protein kinase
VGFSATADSGSGDARRISPGQHRLGDYELIEEIARGGMGVVYKARQLSLGRIVAVKVVLHGPFSSPEFVQRFQKEAEVVAGLHHPNIVAIYEIGQQESDHYFSMEYIEGKNLADAVRDHPLPARRAAAYLKSIAEAVDYAHQRGILHRDLKPSNVLLDVFDRPRVTDFGLAKLLNSDVELTTTGQVLGSPSHISPEQAAGQLGAAAPAGDIYSLGAVLYHLVTGRPPFQGDGVTEILLQVQNNEPVAPRQLNPGVPVDLETICLKCLRKEPARRYGSARALAEDLARFLENKPILARPVGWAGRLARWCSRKPALAAAVGLGGALLLVVAIGSPIAAMHIERERVAAESAREKEKLSRHRAESAEHEAQHQLFAALVGQAGATLRNGEVGQRFGALDALQRATAISNAVQLRREIFTALSLPDMRAGQRLPYGQNYTLRRLDPAFERIALCQRDGPVEIRDVVNGALRTVLPSTTNLDAHVAKWSQNGRYLAVKRDREGSGTEANWEIWDLVGPRLVLIIRDAMLDAVAFHPDGNRVAAGLGTKTVACWDLSDGRQSALLPLQGQPFLMIFDPSGTRFAVTQKTGAGSLITVQDSTSGATQASFLSREQVMQTAWHPRGRWIAFLQSSGAVSLMDPATGEVTVLGRHKSAAVDSEFTPDGNYLLSVGWDSELHCWDTRTIRQAFAGPVDGVTVQVRSDGLACAVKTTAGLQLHEFAPPSGFRDFSEDLGGRLNHAAFSSTGRWLAASGQKHMAVWDASNPGPAALVNPRDEVRLEINQDNELFANNRGICLRLRISEPAKRGDAPQLESLPMPAPPGLVSLCLASNGVVFTGSQGSKLNPFGSLATQPAPWQPTIDGVNGISRDGRWLGMHSAYATDLNIYRMPEMQLARTLTGTAAISDFEFSPRGDEVAVGSDHGVVFWNTGTWQKMRAITNFTGSVYSADGRTCWLTTVNRGSGLFRTGTEELLLQLPASMRPLAISHDGRFLAVSVDAQRLRVWDFVEVRRQLRALGMDWND